MRVYIYKQNKHLNTQKYITIKAVGKNMGKIYVTSMWGRFYKPNNRYR